MSNSMHDLSTIRKRGIEALTEKLGSVGMVEFIRQFDSGYGDYTRERREWLDDSDVQSIGKQIKTKK
ncbi:MAG: hypothetical protein R6U91_06475 [Bacillota bacterium]